MAERCVPYVLLRVVKGNLKHRILKLGTETHIDQLTPDQRVLRCIAVEQGFGSPIPERPPWANGAFLYLHRDEAAVIEDCVRRQGVFLQSKHILVSHGEFVTALDRCLRASPQRSGREAFLVSRAGMVQSETRLLLFRLYIRRSRQWTPIGRCMWTP